MKQSNLTKAGNLLKGGADDVFLNDLTQAIIEQFGGVSTYAAMLFMEFQTAQPGSVARQRCLSMISDLVSRLANLQKDVKFDLSLADEGDLQDMMEALIKDAATSTENQESASAPEDEDRGISGPASLEAPTITES
jgi:hypothetical protein